MSAISIIPDRISSLCAVAHEYTTLSPPSRRQIASLGMNRLLNMRVDLHHILVQLWVLAHEGFRIPCHGNEDSVDAAGERSREAVGDLQTNKESEGKHNGREVASLVICRGGEDEVAISH